MDPSINEQAANIGTASAPLMPAMQNIDKISPFVEMLLQLIQGKNSQPAPSTTSQQTGPYRGPVYNPQTGGLKQQMQGQRAKTQLPDPNAIY
jgi:hypothetical protein